MDHRTAFELLRLDRLEVLAQGYQRRAFQTGNIARMARAARLETIAYNKGMSLVMGDVTTYQD